MMTRVEQLFLPKYPVFPHAAVQSGSGLVCTKARLYLYYKHFNLNHSNFSARLQISPLGNRIEAWREVRCDQGPIRAVHQGLLHTYVKEQYRRLFPVCML